MIAPVSDFINSTIGIDTKPVPVILNVCDVDGEIVCDTSATAGLASTASTQLNWFVLEPLVASTCPLVPTEVGRTKL